VHFIFIELVSFSLQVPKAFEFGESFSKPAKLALAGFQSGGRCALGLSKDNFFS
jgi:hypothetical protein